MGKALNGDSKILLARIEERLDNFMIEIKEEIVEIKSNIKEGHNEFYNRTKKHSEEITGIEQWKKDHVQNHNIVRSWTQHLPMAGLNLLATLVALGTFYFMFIR